jgi:hypothetical protein
MYRKYDGNKLGLDAVFSDVNSIVAKGWSYHSQVDHVTERPVLGTMLGQVQPGHC